MLRKSKILSLLLCFCLLFEQTGFAQVAGALDISGPLSAFRNSFIQDKFRPLHLRSLGYDNNQNNFRLLLDKGDLKNPKKPDLEITTKNLLNYFFVGVTLPNDAFWVNLRPDSENNIIDPDLATTDVGKILLEADLQLKKDTAKFTSPETLEGKEYWEKLYQKAGELLGYENVTIPTLTRPWIVPGEIIIRETKDNAYIYKATLKVMLEQDYLKDSATYNFDDPRLKTLNEYSSQLIRDLIIPKLTKEVNTSQRYAPLRQVYYSLILAQWFKSRFYGKGGLYSWLIDRRGLQGLTSKNSWSKTTYFKAYQKSFKDGEYNIQQPVYTPYGQSVRSYFSGGFVCNVPMPVVPAPGVASERTEGPTKVTAISGDAEHSPLPRTESIVGALAVGGNTMDPSETKVTITEEASSPSGLPAGGLQSGASSVSPTTTNTEETQVTAKQASSPNLGAQVSDVKHLDRLLRLLNVLRRSENVPEIPENASDRDIMEFCIRYLEAKGLITITTDDDGNVIITINNNALNHPDETVRRFVEAIQRWVINPEGGVKAVNFQGKDGVWMIVGFESELQNKDTLEHEQQEIKFRKQGLSWTEAHNQAVAETGKGQRINREEAAKRKAGRQDEIGAMQGGLLGQSVLQGEFGRRNFNREVTEKLRQATEDDLSPSDIGTKIKWQANKIWNLLEQRKQVRMQAIKASPEFIEEQLKKLEGNSEQFTSIYRQMVLDHRIVDMEKGNYIKLYQETKEIFDRIVRAMGFNPEDFELYLTDIGQPNAYAVRWDNKVAVDINMVKALVDNNYSKGALAFVLGHELRHAIQWLDDILDGKEVEVSKKLSIKEMISTKVAGHSDEYDADYFALTLMSDAGYSVRGALDVFNVLYDPQGLAKLLAMDHPPKDERVRKIREAINGWYWEFWDKDEEYFSIETRYESSRRTRLGVFRDSVREVKTYDELMLLINSAHTVQELLMAISKGYQSALKSGVTEKGSFILSKALQAFRNKLANLLAGNPVGGALLDIIENGTVFASYNDHKLYTDDLMKELVKRDPTAAQELEQFFKNEQARIGDLVKENLAKLSNDELDILLKDPLGSSYGGWGFQTNVYRQMVQNITSAKQFDLDKAWHVLDISSGQYLAGVASELMIWILRNGALADSFTMEQWKKYLSYGKFFDGVMEPQRLGEFLAEFRPAALSRPALKEALVEHARTSAPRTADWLENIFQGDLKSWGEEKGNEMILLGQGKSFDEDLDSILSYPVLMTEMIFDSNTSAKAPNRVTDKIWGMLSGKHIVGVKEKSRFAVGVLEKTAKIKISRSTLDREQIGPLYEEFLEAIISYEAEIGSRNSPLSGLDIFLKSGGILGLNEIRHYVSKYADVLSQDDLEHVLVLLDSVKESWRSRYSSWGMFRDTTGEFDNFWRDLLLPIQYHILLKKLGKDQFLIRNGANWFPNEDYDVVASFFNGELGIGSRGNFLESRKIGYQNKHRLNRMNLAGSNAEPAIRILFSIVDGPESFDSLKEVISQTLPASVVRNFLLYGLLLKELRSMGVDITPEQILNEEFILSKMRVLSPEQSNQISEKIKTLEPLFIRDSDMAGQNSQEKGSAMRNAFDEEVDIPAMDQKEPNKYEDALYAEEGGRASQLNVFVPMLDSFLLEQVINSNISFSDKLKEIESRLPTSSTRDYWLNRLLSNHQGVIGEDIANALPLFKDHALRSRWGLAGLDKVFDERRGFSSQQEEIDTVRRFFPEPCYLRDDILLQTMERWVHRPEDDMVAEHLYQNPSHMRQQSQQRDLLSGSMLFSIVPHLTPIGRVNLLLWIMGVSEKKPKWMERFEHFYEVNFDSMRKTLALSSEHYKNAGKTDRRFIIEKIVWGEKPIFQDKDADRILRESLFEAAVGNKGTPIMRDVFDAVFESADNERKLFLIGRLLEVVQAVKFSSNGNSSDEDLTNRITGVFLQAMGIVGVKTGQALGIKYLEDKADPIHRRVVFDMIKKIYGDFGKKFEGVYDRLGSASIKNVFRAKLVNGDEVALKVKRPDVSKTVEDDMNFFEKVIDNLRAKGHVIPAGLVSKVRKMIDEEMDFNLEAFVNQPTLARNVLNRQSGNLGPIASLRSGLVERRLAGRFQKAEGEYTVRVPQAVEEQGNTLLLEELVSQPIPLSNKEALRQQGLDPEDVKKAVRDEMLRQIFVDGIYQLDPNRGNILIQVRRVGDKKEVVINLIDVGAVGHLNNLNKLRLAKVLDAIDARSPKKILFYFVPLHTLNARMGQDIADILATDAVREVKLLNVLDYLEKNGVKVSEEWMGIMRFMAAGKYLFEEHKTDQVITPVDSHGTQTGSQGSSPIDRGFEGDVGEVDSRAFTEAWRSGRSVEISQEHLDVLQDSSMGPAFRTPQVRSISRQAMDDIAQGANVVRLGNQILVVSSYWNSLSEDERLDVLMHEGMADWMERERTGMPAEDAAIDLEGLRSNEAERRAEHLGENQQVENGNKAPEDLSRSNAGEVANSPVDQRVDTSESAKAQTPSGQVDKKGGIDFRALPIVNQQINMGILKLSAADLNRLGNINLDSEWAQIQNMVNAGIIPSNERIKEYVLASCLRENLGNRMDKVLGCIADIMRMEEDRVSDADTELKDMLVLIEAGKPETELQCGLSQIKISPREPQLITP